jgi:ferric-dicitrate binding protein FerR (iron transport regulator)
MDILKRRVASQKRSRWWLLVELVLTLAYPTGGAAAQIQVGLLTGLRGAAIIQRGGHSIAAAMAMPIMLGDKLQTLAESEATISLVDGSQLTLSESTAIVVDQSVVGPRPTDSIINLFKGKLRSVINLRAGSLPDFEVHTPNAVAAARGTDFETEYIEGKPCPGFPQCLRYTDVGVYKGVVEVRNPTSATAPSVLVSSGYETTVPCELSPANPGPLGMGDLSAPGYH